MTEDMHARLARWGREDRAKRQRLDAISFFDATGYHAWRETWLAATADGPPAQRARVEAQVEHFDAILRRGGSHGRRCQS